MGNLLKEYLKRESRLFGMINNILPDPDEIMREQGGSYDIYRELLIDPHLTAAILQRKLQVLQMGWEIESESETLRREGVEIMRQFNMNEIGSELLNAVLYGFNVSEIIWEKEKGKYIPIDIVSKPLEWFGFNEENKLKIIGGAWIGNNQKETIDPPPYKFILSQHHATYVNPYGEKLLKRCYWPIKLKQTTVEGWNSLVEKFGIPYLIGVVSDTATEQEKQDMIDMLLEMIESNVATRGASDIIEIKESGKYEVGALFNN